MLELKSKRKILTMTYVVIDTDYSCGLHKQYMNVESGITGHVILYSLVGFLSVSVFFGILLLIYGKYWQLYIIGLHWQSNML